MILAVISTSALICSAPALALSVEDEAARDIALQWLRVVDSGNYNDAALQMAEEVRTLQNWLGYFAAHRAPLGRVNNRHVVEIKHASTVPGDPELRPHAIIRFKTSFERPPSSTYGAASKAAATEEVVMAKMGCCWEIFGYTIEAN